MKIPSKIPGKLSIRAGVSPIFTGGAASYDYALGGIPFLSAASEMDYGRRKIRRTTAPFRKEQVDQQINPGEQSLAGYWLRSQISFHSGAGQLYSDPGQANPQSDTRFWRSKNVNPWVRGKASLLSLTVQNTATTLGRELASIEFSTGPVAAVAGINNTNFFTQISPALTVATQAFATQPYSVTTDGSNVYVAAADGLYKAPIPAAQGAFTFAKIYTFAVTRSAKVAWIKARLILGVDSALYECVPSPAGPPAALPAAFYTALAPGWNWTSLTETTNSIYCVGSTGSAGDILKFSLVASGTTLTLSGGSVACTLPGGEVPFAALGYLGDFLGIGTNKGARVARAESNGDLTYGPLLFETTEKVLDFAGRDRFLWCSYSEADEDDIRLARIDLSTEIETLRFAYATDLCGIGDNNNTTSVAFYGGSDALAFVTAAGIWSEDPTKRAVTGFLDTSRIRFSTLEPKVFRSIRVRGPLLTGTLGVSVIDEAGTVTPLYSYGVDQTPGEDDLTITGPDLRDFLSFRFTLNQSANTLTGAELNGWQVKALPGSPRQRMIILPLWCYDFEKDRHGQRVGGHRRAIGRLMALENLEATGSIIQFQDLTSNTAGDVFIEEMEFEQSDPPPRFEGWGGIIRVTLRTV